MSGTVATYRGSSSNSGRLDSITLAAHAQAVLELVEPRIVLPAERLNFIAERLQPSFGRGRPRRVLIVENANFIAEDLDALFHLGEIGRDRCPVGLTYIPRTAFQASGCHYT